MAGRPRHSRTHRRNWDHELWGESAETTAADQANVQSAVAALRAEDSAHRLSALPEDIARAETALGVTFPDDFRQFLRWSDGYNGTLGNVYLRVWDTSQIVDQNEGYEIQRSLPVIVGIGDNGGGDFYALD